MPTSMSTTADGNYVKRIYVTQDELAANDYRVRVEGLPRATTSLWCGAA